MNYDQLFQRRLDNKRRALGFVVENECMPVCGFNCVYFVRRGIIIKIGKTTDLYNRVVTIKDQCLSSELKDPIKIDLVGILIRNDHTQLEKRIHKLFKDINYDHEWFYDDERIHKYLSCHMTRDDKRCVGNFEKLLKNTYACAIKKSEFRLAFEEWSRTHGHLRNWYEQTDPDTV